MYVTPKAGLVVIDPARLNTPEDRLPPEGREVGDDNAMYWHRRVLDGDVTAGEPPAAPEVEQA